MQETAVLEVGRRKGKEIRHGVANGRRSAASAASCFGQRFNLSLPRNGIRDAHGPPWNTKNKWTPHHVTWSPSIVEPAMNESLPREAQCRASQFHVPSFVFRQSRIAPRPAQFLLRCVRSVACLHIPMHVLAGQTMPSRCQLASTTQTAMRAVILSAAVIRRARWA